MKFFPASVHRDCPHGPVCNRASRYQGLTMLLWALLAYYEGTHGGVGMAVFCAWSCGITLDAWLAHVNR